MLSCSRCCSCLGGLLAAAAIKADAPAAAIKVDTAAARAAAATGGGFVLGASLVEAED